jgi:hypothetical protein
MTEYDLAVSAPEYVLEGGVAGSEYPDDEARGPAQPACKLEDIEKGAA